MAKKKILIVDDEPSLLEFVKAILEKEGYDVITAGSGQECLTTLTKLRPDIVLIDMILPGMSGRETVQKIRCNPKTKSLKIAFLTVAKFSEVGKNTIKDFKVSDYITKPFDNADLVKRIKKIID